MAITLHRLQMMSPAQDNGACIRALFWLPFSTVGGGGDTLSIFIYVSGPALLKALHWVCCVAHWIPRSLPSYSFDPHDSKTCYVKVYVFIFLWENHDVVRLGLQSGVTQSLDTLGGKCLFTEANSAKFGPGLRAVRGGLKLRRG